ncbi:unnamed protein product [Oppiella nova]|uniref:Uncharacterized protein n=1 Tax=Oppiella nova TaxID=334625 RepID=A0A7R9MDZ9_9ACAR|nr:unnamed protein product [Oppiella nova]CAG2175459.1 unnamed protein product [Oppiella nova]
MTTLLNAEAPGTNESTKTASKVNKSETKSKGNQSLAEEDDNELEEVLRMSVESKAETESRQMETALALSLESTPKPINQFSTEDEMVDRALAMSLEGL